MKTRAVILGVVVLLVFATVITTVTLVIRHRNMHGEETAARFDPAGSALDFFKTNDALAITWYHGANRKKQLQEAIDGDYMMIEGDINVRWHGYPNETREPIMAHPPDVDSDNTLDNWMDKLLTRSDKGLKFDFKSDQVIRPSLEALRLRGRHVSHPVWFNADIVRGPGGMNGTPRNAEAFIQAVNEVFPRATLSVGWTTGCCNETYTYAMMQDMWDKTKYLKQTLTFPARAALLKQSWSEFKWLLDKAGNTSSITVWTPAGRNDWEGADIYDLLYVRNDIDKKYIYYDLPGPKFAEFRRLVVTAGSLFNFFPIPRRDGLLVTWGHGVNSRAQLEEALRGNTMMLEAYVLLRGQGTVNQTTIPVMAHPPDIDSDITLAEWIDRVVQSDRGIKLDFKGFPVVEHALKILQAKKDKIAQPVWLNASIFRGPNARGTGVNATEFKRLVLQYFPESTLSNGWTTVWNNRPDDQVYTSEMIDVMRNYLQGLKQPITFPVRAAMVKRAWPHLSRIVNLSRGHTLTIWSSKSDVVDPEDMVYVRRNIDADKVFYDLPEPLMSEFKRLLEREGLL